LTPGAKPNAWSYGTKTWVRMTLLRMHQNMKVLPASTRAADVNRPMGDDPSNGAITRLDTPPSIKRRHPDHA
jgi:hypothetical protein